jgi:hypothetical protein
MEGGSADNARSICLPRSAQRLKDCFFRQNPNILVSPIPFSHIEIFGNPAKITKILFYCVNISFSIFGI